jgi:putative transposase
MARVPRGFTVKAGLATHMTFRGHNKEHNLGLPAHKAKYLEILMEDFETHDCGATLEAFAIMGNHAHQVLFIHDQKKFSDHMRRVNGQYGQWFNRTHPKGRSGKVAEGRPHTTLIQDARYRKNAVFYVHANPLRLSIQDSARYPYSSHLFYAYGKRTLGTKHLKPPDWYLAMGDTPEKRQRKYRREFAQYLKNEGRQKQDFLKKRFYGELLWMIENNSVVREWRKSGLPAPPPPS